MISQNFEAKPNKPKNEEVDPELQFKCMYYFNAGNFYNEFNEFLTHKYSSNPELADRIIELQAALKTTQSNPERFSSLAMKHLDKYNRGEANKKSKDYSQLFIAYLDTKAEPPMTIYTAPETQGEAKKSENLESIDRFTIKHVQQFFVKADIVDSFLNYLTAREKTSTTALKLKLKIKGLQNYKELAKIMSIQVYKGKEEESKYHKNRELVLDFLEKHLSTKTREVFASSADINNFTTFIQEKFKQSNNKEYLKMIAFNEKNKENPLLFALSMNSHLIDGRKKEESKLYYQSLLEYMLKK